MSTEDLPLIMQVLQANPNAEIITIMGSQINNGQHNLQGSLENQTAEVIPMMEPSPMMGEAMMNQNNDLRNSNSALQQERDELIRATYNEYNG